MSLRDQLLAKGLASKKDAKRVERELAEQRRVEQGARRSKSELEAVERARREAEDQQRLDAQKRARLEAQRAREAVERELRLRNLIHGNRQRPGRGQRFFHRSAEGRSVLRLEVSSGTAWELRAGDAAIAWTPRAGLPLVPPEGRIYGDAEADYVVIPRKAAVRLLELAPERLVFYVADPTGSTDRALGFAERAWDTSLTPRRATPEDLERWRTRLAVRE